MTKDEEAVERLEAFLKTFDHVHETSTLAPGLMLGDLRILVETLSALKSLMRRYLPPDSEMSAEQFAGEVIGLLDRR
jgi:hypothetical protein